jgi:hypothetical protein
MAMLGTFWFVMHRRENRLANTGADGTDIHGVDHVVDHGNESQGTETQGNKTTDNG